MVTSAWCVRKSCILCILYILLYTLVYSCILLYTFPGVAGVVWQWYWGREPARVGGPDKQWQIPLSLPRAGSPLGQESVAKWAAEGRGLASKGEGHFSCKLWTDIKPDILTWAASEPACPEFAVYQVLFSSMSPRTLCWSWSEVHQWTESKLVVC